MERFGMNVVIGMSGNCDASLFDGMFVLLVPSFGVNTEPAVFLDKGDHLSKLHEQSNARCEPLVDPEESMGLPRNLKKVCRNRDEHSLFVANY
jgi:hypothetical protein